MSKVRATALYARISADTEGLGKGTERQLEDCRKLAESLGWAVYDEYVDNDVSAYSGKQRPSYERMLNDIEAGVVDAVVVYNIDRLTRRPIEFEVFNEILTKAGVHQVRFVTGDVDLGNDDGLFYGRLQAAFAAKESATKSRRIKRKLDQVAAEGRPHGGSNRPFGFEDDKITHQPDEAEVIRQLVKRFLAGESLKSLANWLQDQGVPTVRGGPWHTSGLRTLFANPRIAGLRQHREEIIGPAVWDPIISTEDRERILTLMESRKNSGRRTPRRYLLSGLLRCGKCGQRLYSMRRDTTRRYVCQSGPDHGGCGCLTVVAAPLEGLIVDAVLLRLDTYQLADALSGANSADAETLVLRQAVSADAEQLDELARAYANKDILHREWMAARQVIERRMHDNERKLRRVTDTSGLAEVLGQGDALRRQWSTLNLGRQRAIIDTLLDHAVIGPGVRGARELDPARVTPVWRL